MESKGEIEAMLVDIRERLKRLEERLRPEPTCYRFPEAAARLGVSESTLKRMIRAGEVRTSKVGRVPMVSLAEIHRVSAPETERPQVEARARAAAWTPIVRKRGA